jgi:hypothetical protein
MELLRTGRLVALTTVIFAFAGCGGTTSAVPGAMTQGVAHQASGKSWMLPQAKGEDLIYLSAARGIYVYTYPKGKHVGTLTTPNYAAHECADTSGDVFITSYAGSQQGVYEYAHGGSQPINFLPLTEAYACSVDPTTGNLAVIQDLGEDVYVYPDATGTPTSYSDSNVFMLASLTYDGSGNLFVSGQAQNKYRTFSIIELPQGSDTFEQIQFQNTYNGDDDEPILWDGKYLGLGTLQLAKHRRRTSQLVVDLIQISGTSGSVVGEARMALQHKSVPQWAIYNGIAIDPTNGAVRSPSYFSYFKYPGGKDLQTIKMPGVYDVAGTVLSVAPPGTRIHK